MHMHFRSDITSRENLSTLTFSQLILFAISKQHLEENYWLTKFPLMSIKPHAARLGANPMVPLAHLTLPLAHGVGGLRF